MLEVSNTTILSGPSKAPSSADYGTECLDDVQASLNSMRVQHLGHKIEEDMLDTELGYLSEALEND